MSSGSKNKTGHSVKPGSPFWIETFGCQMNKSDSELIVQSLSSQGFVQGTSAETSDILIFNTCSVRQNAEDRVTGIITSQRQACKERGALIILSGCMAQRVGTQLVEDDIADIVIGPYQAPAVGKIVLQYISGKSNNIFTSQESGDFEGRLLDEISSEDSKGSWHSFVTITHGCENYCSYCIVPYVRGKLISFSSERIISHVKKLIRSGVKEITLLGQNVNQYGTDCHEVPFYKLLESISVLPDLKRLGFLTSHPKDLTEDVIKVIADNPVISRSLHLPLQSGSNRILEAMNRNYTQKHYYSIVELLHKHIPVHSISTDLIVGFPSESLEEFNETLNAVKRVRFDEAYMYAYSPREGTPSFDLKEFISQKEKINRLNELIKIQRAIGLEKLKARIGTTDEIIVDKISKKSDSQVMGRTSLNHPVVIDGSSNDIGTLLPITINGIHGTTLQASRI